MTLRCDDVRDLAPVFVLGALEPAGDREVRAHLRTCAEAHDEVETFGGVVPYLNDTVELVEPPAALKSRVLAAVAAQPQVEGGARPSATVARAAAPLAPAAPTLWSDAGAETVDVPTERSTRTPKRGEPMAVGPGRPDAA
ncbi:MAG: zf-HC2 domain-containing protein [Chloroflexota bacterium]